MSDKKETPVTIILPNGEKKIISSKQLEAYRKKNK